MPDNPAMRALRHHVTGSIERGESEPITAVEDTGTPNSPSLTLNDSFRWNDRTWLPVTEACNTDEMFAFLRARYFAYDSETARAMASGGTFDITSWPRGRGNGTFTTFTVVSAFAGLVRLYRASDTRELRNGSTW